MRREHAALQRRAIPDDLWKRTLVRYPFLRRHDDPGATALRRLTSLFLDAKSFTVVGDLRLNDALVVSIAAQACLPILRLGLAAYDSFVGIVVHADQVVAAREVMDDFGVVHQFEEVLAGETVRGGPVMLSWRDVRAAGRGDAAAGTGAYCVVIHEFAHVLDLAQGPAEALPILPPDIPVPEWRAVMRASQLALVRLLESGTPTALDAYGAESLTEFFAVAAEAFFVTPAEMKNEHPALYGMLVRYFRQDPADEQPRPRR
jgi:Mlc titration factor MtfA (ptsG expression regulator)